MAIISSAQLRLCDATMATTTAIYPSLGREQLLTQLRASRDHTIRMAENALVTTVCIFCMAELAANPPRTKPELVLHFHVKFLSTSCCNGKDCLPRLWRHVAASFLHGTGRSVDAKGHLLHASHAIFETY